MRYVVDTLADTEIILRYLIMISHLFDLEGLFVNLWCIFKSEALSNIYGSCEPQ